VTRFPACSGESVAGNTHTFPAEFAGHTTVAVVGFKPDHAQNVMSWVPFVSTYLKPGGAVQGFVFLALPKQAKMMRKMIEPMIRGAIKEAAAQDAAILVYTEVKAFREALAIPDENALAVLVVNGAGEVVARTSGAFDEAKGAVVAEALSV
jgi:hypothetical protein